MAVNVLTDLSIFIRPLPDKLCNPEYDYVQQIGCIAVVGGPRSSSSCPDGGHLFIDETHNKIMKLTHHLQKTLGESVYEWSRFPNILINNNLVFNTVHWKHELTIEHFRFSLFFPLILLQSFSKNLSTEVL